MRPIRCASLKWAKIVSNARTFNETLATLMTTVTRSTATTIPDRSRRHDSRARSQTSKNSPQGHHINIEIWCIDIDTKNSTPLEVRNTRRYLVASALCLVLKVIFEMYFELQGRMTAQTADIIQVKCCQRLAQNTKQIYNCNSYPITKTLGSIEK